MLNIKTLRDYLNSLDLDEVSKDVCIVYHSSDGTHCESMDDFQLCFPDGCFKPYLSIYTESFVQALDDFGNDD